MATAAVPLEEDLPVVKVYKKDGTVSVQWGEGGAQQTSGGLTDSYTNYFHATYSTGREPFIKTFGTILHCNDGILNIGQTRYRIQVQQQQQDGKLCSDHSRIFEFKLFQSCKNTIRQRHDHATLLRLLRVLWYGKIDH